MKSTELRPHAAVVDGKRLGTIERAYFDPKQRTIIGFAITTGGGFMMPEAGLIADHDEIASIGRDMITLTTATPAGTKTNEQYGDLIDLDSLHGRDVYTDQGQHLGRVEWSEFDERSFALTGLMTHSGTGQHQPITASRIIAIGPDLISVKTDAAGSAAA